MNLLSCYPRFIKLDKFFNFSDKIELKKKEISHDLYNNFDNFRVNL